MSYVGMSATSGRKLDDLAHIRQSIRDILTTPVGSRVMRRNYGSLAPLLIDQPLNGATRLRVMSAAVTALVRWEPRVRITSTTVELGEAGELYVAVEADRIDGPRREAAGPMRISLREGPV